MTINQTTNTSQTNQASQQQTVRMTSQQTNNNKYQTTNVDQTETTNKNTTQKVSSEVKPIVKSSLTTGQKIDNFTSQPETAQKQSNVSTVESSTTQANNDTYNANYQTQKQQYAASQHGDQRVDQQVSPVSGNQDQAKSNNSLINQNNQVSQPTRTIYDSDSTSNGTTNPTMTSDEHQADYHLTTQSGWSNDVQTIVKNPKGYYDIYFLQGPGGAQDHGTTVWEHTTTTDFKNFGPQNTAIGVGKGGNSWYGAATGSVVINQGNIAGVPKGDMVAYFTGYHNVQSIYAAYSDDDGKTFSHVLNNGDPIVNYNSNGASQDPNNFRDASVVYWNGKMLMYCAEGSKFGIFSSTNGLNWNHAGDAGADQFAKGVTFDNSDVPVECPVLRNMTDNQGKSHIVLFYGGKNNAAHQTTGTYYTVGHLDDNGLFVADDNTQRLDLGSDFYAANFDGSDDLGTANASIISLGWIGNWGYTGSGVYANENNHTYPADKGQLSQRLGSYSLLRKLTLNSNGMISDAPLLNTANSGNAVQCSTDKPSNSTRQKQVITEYDNNQADTLYDHANEPADSIYDLHFSTKNGHPYKGRIYIDIWQGADNVRLNFDPTNGWMQCRQYAKELDNDPTGMNASNNYQNGTLGNKGGYSANTELSNMSSFDIKVFCDKDSVEFFFPNGQAYTVARFATQNTQDFKVYTQDPTDNNQLSVQKLTLATAINNPTDPDKSTNNSSSSSSNSTNKPAGSLPTNSGPSTNNGSADGSSKVTSYVWNNNVNFVIPTTDKNHNITLHVEGTYHDSQTKSSAFTEDANAVYQNAIKHIPAGFKLDGSEAMHVSTQTSVKNGVQTTTANWNIIVKMATQDTLHVDYVYNGKTVGTYDETSPLPLDNVLGIANQHIPSGYKFVKDDVAKGGSDGHFTAEVEVAPVSGNGNTSSNSHADDGSNSKPAQSGSQGGSSSTTKPSVNGNSNKPSQGSSTPVTKPSTSSNSSKPAQSGSQSGSTTKPSQGSSSSKPTGNTSGTLQPDEGTGTASHPYYAYHFDIKYVDPSGKIVGTKTFDGKASGALPSNLTVARMLKDGVPSGYTTTTDDCLKAASQAKATNNNGVEDFTFMVPVTAIKNSSSTGSTNGSTSSEPTTQPSTKPVQGGSSTNKPVQGSSTQPSTKPSQGSSTSAEKPSGSTSEPSDHHSQQPANNPNDVNHDQGSATGNKPTDSTSSTTDSKPSASTGSAAHGSVNSSESSGSIGSANNSKPSGTTTNSKPSSATGSNVNSTSADKPSGTTDGSSTDGSTVNGSNGSSSVANSSSTDSASASDDHQGDNSSTAMNGGTTATTDHVDAQDKTTSTTTTKPTDSAQSTTKSATPTSSTNESLSGKSTTSTNDSKSVSSSENAVATKTSSRDMTTPNATGTAPMTSTSSDNHLAPLSETTATTDHTTVSSSSSADTVKPLQVNTGNTLAQTGEEDNSLGLAVGLAATAVVAALVADSKDKK